MAKVVVISLSDLGSDPRVERQIVALTGRYDVLAAGLGPPKVEGVGFVPLDPPDLPSYPVLLLQLGLIQVARLLGFHRRAYRAQHNLAKWRDALRTVSADLVVVNDTQMLPLVFETSRGSPIVFDAHEYSPDEYTNWSWRIFARPHMRWICRTYIPRTAGMMVVGPGIGELYARDTGVKPVVVTNAPPYAELAPTPVGERVRLIHVGLADPQRRLEDTIRVMRELDDRYSLDFLLAGADWFPSYVERLRRLAAGDPRIRFLDPVPMREIPRFANAYDIGVFLLPPRHTNQELALPNKFFEYIQGRIVPAIGPSSEMARIVEEWDCGIVAPDFRAETLATSIRATTAERLEEMKRNAAVAARSLCAERNEELILEVAAKALQG